jgi:hypothetical protein
LPQSVYAYRITDCCQYCSAPFLPPLIEAASLFPGVRVNVFTP